MPTHKVLFCSLLVFLIAVPPSYAHPPGIDPDYTPFPAGYGYMQDPDALQRAAENNDKPAIRAHAWKLWAGIMQPGKNPDWPLWATWPNTSIAFLPAPPSDGSGLAAVPLKQRVLTQDAIPLIRMNRENYPKVETNGPGYPIPQAVVDQYPDVVKKDSDGSYYIAKNGRFFLFNGDIMIPTESLSWEAYTSIRGNNRYYLRSTLNRANIQGVKRLEVDQRAIVTKHMYWPVKADGITALPVWKGQFANDYTGYVGYEVWDTLIGIDPSKDGKDIGKIKSLAFLYGVKNPNGNTPFPTVKRKGKVYGIKDFYYHKVTAEDWQRFNDADKAILQASSYWANNQPFEIGDYLITVAMHVNTKELYDWTLQSVWWSDEPNKGPFAADRPNLPTAKGPWDHYLLTDDYPVPRPVGSNLPIAVNPYIEGVVHPIATSCRNCHVRAGWPKSSNSKPRPNTASYQNPECPNLLESLTPESACFNKLTLTDFLWIIPDRARR